MWSLPVCISHREMVNDSRAHSTRVSSTLFPAQNAFHTGYTWSNSLEAVSLTERCWMTLSIYWGAQHNLAPVGRPRYTAVHNYPYVTFHYIRIHCTVPLFSATNYNSSAHRKAVRDEAMHRLGCSYIVNLPWSLVIHRPYWSTL